MWWLVVAALAHPGASGHDPEGCDDVPALLRHAAGLVEEGRASEAREALARGASCGADPVELALAEAALLRGEGRHAEALAVIAPAVARAPGPATWLARAAALDALGQDDRAAADRLAALDQTEHPGPDLFVATARSLERAGRPAEALAVVDRGLLACGAVASLVVVGVELTTPEDALRRLDAMPPTAAWLRLRGTVLARAGRVDEARAVLARALAAAEASRPSPKRSATIEEIQAELQRFEP